MAQELSGQVAVITGASRGIGLAIARRVVELGARVCVTGRNAEALAEAVESLGGARHAIAIAGRADSAEHRDETVAAVLERFGRLDILVNNVGINPAYLPLMDVDLGLARKTLEVNALAPLGWTQVAYHSWMADHGGAVVNVSSLGATSAAPGLGLYGASKAMLEQLTRSLAQELAPRVRVNAVAPAVIKTAFASKLYEGREPEVAARFPLGRLGTPEDVAHAVGYLVSSHAAWITGEVIVLDGGLRLTGGY